MCLVVERLIVNILNYLCKENNEHGNIVSVGLYIETEKLTKLTK